MTRRANHAHIDATKFFKIKNFLSPRRVAGFFNQTVERFGAVVSLECCPPSSIAFAALGDIGMAKAALIRSTCRVALAGLVSLCFCGAALSKDASDGDDEPAKAASTPNLYLDLRTYYTTVPAGSLSLGFGNSALFATLPTLATLSALTTLPTLPTLSSPASRSSGRRAAGYAKAAGGRREPAMICTPSMTI